MTLLPYALDFALVCFGAAILMNLWLVARGPGVRAARRRRARLPC